jgi:class 3 adenylate cyclase
MSNFNVDSHGGMVTVKPDALQSYPVLVIDDEPQILKIITRQLETEETLRITAVSDPKQALEALDHSHFALIISDNNMPQMTGIELLRAAMERSPHSRRVLLTGYTDQTAAIHAFNDHVIHRYMNKPWDKSKLLGIVREQLEAYDQLQRDDSERQELKSKLQRRNQQLRATREAAREIQDELGEAGGPAIRHRLAAVAIADVVSYSRLMGDDPEATLNTLNDCRAIWRRYISRYDGRLVNSHGDSLLAEFGSAAKATRCAREVQSELNLLNAELPVNRRMHYRVGVAVGEVLEQGGSLYGDGVNIAGRLQSLAEPGEVWISRSVFENIKPSIDVAEFAGEHKLHNIAEPVGAYRIRGQRISA